MKAFKILIIIAFNIFSQDENLCGQSLCAEIISPSVIESNDILTIAVRIRNEDMSLNHSITGTFQLLLSQGTVEKDSIQIYMGTGSLTTKISSIQNFSLSIKGFSGEKEFAVVDSFPVKEIGGLIDADLTLFSDTIYQVTQNITIAEESLLEIKKGCHLYPEENVNIFILGRLIMDGTLDDPILVRSSDPEKKWGGFFIQNNTLESAIRYSFFIFGGNDENHVFGHSESQPVIMVDHSSLSMVNAFIIDNPGKACGGNLSQLIIENCLFSRCDTGGEYHYSHVEITGSYFIEFPINDGIPADDDNDACYFYNTHPQKDEPSLIQKCVFINGKDDGIDHQGAKLSIINCWIEGFDNEGIAASGFNFVSVFNTVVKNCGQGIEAGYGSPEVMVDHCLVISNGVGLRFGDSYNWGSEGKIEASNSIFFENDDNILNFDLLTQGPVAGVVDIIYSITNDPEYDEYPGCIAAVPLFAYNFLLLPESPGKGMALNGLDMGLTSTLLEVKDFNQIDNNQVMIFPNPYDGKGFITIRSRGEKICSVFVFNLHGKLIFSEKMPNRNHSFETVFIPNISLSTGLYFFTIALSNGSLLTKKVIVQ